MSDNHKDNRDNHLKHNYRRVKMGNTLYCILFSALFIASFFLESDIYFKIGLSFIIVLNSISFIILRRRVENMRLYLIVTEIITIGMITGSLLLTFEILYLFIIPMFIMSSVETMSLVWNKDFFNYSLDREFNTRFNIT